MRVADALEPGECRLDLHDVDTGTRIEFGDVNEVTKSVKLPTKGRSQVYLGRLLCTVDVSG